MSSPHPTATPTATAHAAPSHAAPMSGQPGLPGLTRLKAEVRRVRRALLRRALARMLVAAMTVGAAIQCVVLLGLWTVRALVGEEVSTVAPVIAGPAMALAVAGTVLVMLRRHPLPGLRETALFIEHHGQGEGALPLLFEGRPLAGGDDQVLQTARQTMARFQWEGAAPLFDWRALAGMAVALACALVLQAMVLGRVSGKPPEVGARPGGRKAGDLGQGNADRPAVAPADVALARLAEDLRHHLLALPEAERAARMQELARRERARLEAAGNARLHAEAAAGEAQSALASGGANATAPEARAKLQQARDLLSGEGRDVAANGDLPPLPADDAAAALLASARAMRDAAVRSAKEAQAALHALRAMPPEALAPASEAASDGAAAGLASGAAGTMRSGSLSGGAAGELAESAPFGGAAQPPRAGDIDPANGAAGARYLDALGAE